MKESTYDSMGAGMGRIKNWLDDENNFVCLLVVVTFSIVFMVEMMEIDFSHPYFSLDEYAVSEWVKEHSNPDDAILTAPNSIYPALMERPVVICEPMSQTSFLYGTGEFDINNYSNYNQSVCG